MKVFFPKKSGFSLVSVMVAAALMGILAVTFTKLISNSQKGQQNVQNAVDFDILKSSFSLLLNSRSCDGAFKRSAGGDLLQITVPAGSAPGTALISTGTPLPIFEIMFGSSSLAKLNDNLGGGMVLDKLELIDAIYEGDVSIGTPPVIYHSVVASLNIGAKKQASAYGAKELKQQYLVRLFVNSVGGHVEKCGGAQSPIANMRFCTNAQSSAGHPDAVLECVAATFNNGAGTITGTIKAAPVNCQSDSAAHHGRFAAGISWIVATKSWRSYGTVPVTCKDGTTLIAFW